MSKERKKDTHLTHLTQSSLEQAVHVQPQQARYDGPQNIEGVTHASGSNRLLFLSCPCRDPVLYVTTGHRTCYSAIYGVDQTFLCVCVYVCGCLSTPVRLCLLLALPAQASASTPYNKYL